MSIQRRFLPPLSWLSAFEATARLDSVTAAANELNLTQGAVSRQIGKLEDQLGVALFLRVKKRLILTAQGRAYAEAVKEAISQISAATIELTTNPAGGALELAILPAFGTHWLAPRLPDFLSKAQGVTINLSTRIEPFDFAQERFHAAIHFGEDNWPGAQSLKLMDEVTLPLVAPTLAAGSSKTLANIPLLTLRTRHDAWQRWYTAQGLGECPDPSMSFDQFATMTQAAAAGLGAVLLPKYLAKPEIEAGRLIQIEATTTTSLGAYYLVWPKGLSDYPPLQEFQSWIRQQDFQS